MRSPPSPDPNPPIFRVPLFSICVRLLGFGLPKISVTALVYLSLEVLIYVWPLH